jgi:hypothetical protein
MGTSEEDENAYVHVYVLYVRSLGKFSIYFYYCTNGHGLGLRKNSQV